jgi:hypothetical protein
MLWKLERPICGSSGKLAAILFAAIALVANPGFSIAQEAIAGWGAVKFGMSRAAVREATNSELSEFCTEGVLPLNCNAEVFAEKAGGIQYSVLVYFDEDGGAAMINVYTDNSGLGPEALEIYDNFKQAFSKKYGVGQEFEFDTENKCVAARQLWDSEKVVPNLFWIKSSFRKFVIIRDEGSIVWLVTKRDLCPETPIEVAPGVRRIDQFPTYNLQVVYRKSAEKLPAPF